MLFFRRNNGFPLINISLENIDIIFPHVIVFKTDFNINLPSQQDTWKILNFLKYLEEKYDVIDEDEFNDEFKRFFKE